MKNPKGCVLLTGPERELMGLCGVMTLTNHQDLKPMTRRFIVRISAELLGKTQSEIQTMVYKNRTNNG